MNQEDILNMFNGNFNQGFEQEEVPVEKLDEFIQKVRDKNDETLYSLAQAISYKLNTSPILSFEEVRILPQVISRIEEKLSKGEI